MIVVCPCGNWQLDAVEAVYALPYWELYDLFEETVKEHERECVVLSASHIAAEAAPDQGDISWP